MQEIDFCVTTLDRYHLLNELIDSIFKFYPNAKVTVADQSRIIDTKFYNKWRWRDLKVLPLPFDCGLSMARNLLVEETERKYKLILEDDFLFTKETRIEGLLELMDVADIAGGSVYRKGIRIPFEHYFEKLGDTIYQRPDGDLFMKYKTVKYKPTGCVLNFFLANSIVFKDTMWYNELKLREHQHFFYRVKSKIVFTDDVRIEDNKKENSKSYKRLKGRDEFWKIALEDLKVKKVQYLSGKVVELEGDKIQHYKL